MLFRATLQWPHATFEEASSVLMRSLWQNLGFSGGFVVAGVSRAFHRACSGFQPWWASRAFPSAAPEQPFPSLQARCSGREGQPQCSPSGPELHPVAGCPELLCCWNTSWKSLVPARGRDFALLQQLLRALLGCYSSPEPKKKKKISLCHLSRIPILLDFCLSLGPLLSVFYLVEINSQHFLFISWKRRNLSSEFYPYLRFPAALAAYDMLEIFCGFGEIPMLFVCLFDCFSVWHPDVLWNRTLFSCKMEPSFS